MLPKIIAGYDISAHPKDDRSSPVYSKNRDRKATAQIARKIFNFPTPKRLIVTTTLPNTPTIINQNDIFTNLSS